MLEKPDIQDDRLIDCLRQSYGLDIKQLEFLPLGNDPAAWVYRFHAESDSDYFLKVKKGAIKAASVQVPRHLKDQGIDQVVAPLYTGSQRPASGGGRLHADSLPSH